jgi:tRNA (adenine22-N1)-methyltransferase
MTEVMMVLKPRLKLIYDMIPTCDILSDIGTDHALLPAYALLNRRCKKAIASDIKKGPLKRAKQTLDYYKLHSSMELRLGNGLEILTEEEADCIVLAGMGGILITELMNKSISIAKAANNIILQPMTSQEVVRPFLWTHGFEVTDEGLAREGDKIYQALSVRYTGNIRNNWDVFNEIIGERLIIKNDPLLEDWVRNLTKKQERIVKGLEVSKSPGPLLEKERILLEKLKNFLKTRKYHDKNNGGSIYEA